MVPVLEAVPNFSAGRDPSLLEELVRVAEEEGAEVLDASADADHNRSVVTLVGAPRAVEDACVAMAGLAVESIDLRAHRGAHPRVGALDVLPLVPLLGLSLSDARASARRIGPRLAEEIGVPVYYYGEASDPPGRRLAELRRGGFESLARDLREGMLPDVVPSEWSTPSVHPTAGAVCVGARLLLLAWNLDVEGLALDDARAVAAKVRECGGGLPGVRALGLQLETQGRTQISMNLEDVQQRQPLQVFRMVMEEVEARGGRVRSTEVIGMIPDELILPSAADRLSLLDPNPSRVLSSRVVDHVARRAAKAAADLVREIERAGDAVPDRVREAGALLAESLIGSTLPDERA